ncbi:MAG: 4-hydroxy-tetrahydrodipicolinate synthase, partial [Armatimonadota bacterium]
SGSGRHPLGKMNLEGIQIVRKAMNSVWSNNPEILEPIGHFYSVDIAARLADDRIWDELRYI